MISSFGIGGRLASVEGITGDGDGSVEMVEGVFYGDGVVFSELMI